MFLYFILLSVTAASFAKGSNILPLIVNGTDARIEEFPSMVSLRIGNFHNCAGTLLNEYWVLTAAHCIMDADPDEHEIEYGMSVVSNGISATKTAKIEKFIPHQEFSYSTLRNDIGLIKLKTAVHTGFHDTLAKLAVPGKYYATGTKTTVAGWGRIASGQPISTILQKVDLQIYSYEDCKAAHRYEVFETNICAGVPEMGKAECNGDSGGPLYVNGVQVGIVSWSEKPCAVAPYPGVYTDLTHYIDWIEYHTGLVFSLDMFLRRKL